MKKPKKLCPSRAATRAGQKAIATQMTRNTIDPSHQPIDATSIPTSVGRWSLPGNRSFLARGKLGHRYGTRGHADVAHRPDHRGEADTAGRPGRRNKTS